MPTFRELATDPVTWAFFGLFFGLWLLEYRYPARALPSVPGHHARGSIALALFFLVSSYLPYLVAPALGPFKIAELEGWGLSGAAAAMVVYQLLGYVYHRSLHASERLFRAVHQLHHSSERLDVASAFLFAPLDMAGWTLVSTLALGLIGITPQATVAFVLCGTFLSVLQHANLRTPRWLGYLVQRPESHSHHHARGVHRFNYADLPVIDLIFGTFYNPPHFAPATGYYGGASARVGDMLLFRDVTTPDASRLAEGAPQRSEAPTVLSGGQPY